MSTNAPEVIVADIDIQKRERDLVIGTYGRGIYIADIHPFKEFKKETFDKAAHLFDIQRTIKWNRYEMRGPRFGEFAAVDNPQVGSAVYYYLKDPVKSVRVVIKDLVGQDVQELRGGTEKGIKRVFWDLRKKAAPAAEGQRFPRAAALVDPGKYRVTLIVDEKEVETKELEVIPDPLFRD
jgi:hypothetical protein